ncbi:HIT domain-containing protein [Trinickia violacea]|uniref:HIT domain-containing protein n=1 Tax=Trinickia violacea TaxID=2571746 RepID=A0A4P8IPB6_9BURK|nr:HIT domain-containing protein [Trinickia violacea]QCP49931.1 HIT domain-containing protein [Trinickia violacea]
MTYDPNNPFAKILRGDAPCVKVCETGDVMAFMDLMPQSDGHVLVVPKEPAATLFDLSDAGAEASIRVVRRVALAVRAALAPDGVFVGQFNGRAAGQTVEHVHFHVIPRWADQPLRMHARVVADAAELEALAERIRAHLRD